MMETNKTVFVLMLNDMRSHKIEILSIAAVADSKEALGELMERETDPHMDGRWGKKFRAGGPLEWFNDISLSNRHIVEIPFYSINPE